MKTEIIVLSVNHYDMEGKQGLSVRVLGDFVQTNNKFGVEVSEASVSNYEELKNLSKNANDLPAKFKANISLGVIKDRNGKEKSGVNLSNLEFVNSVELLDKKAKVSN